MRRLGKFWIIAVLAGASLGARAAAAAPPASAAMIRLAYDVTYGGITVMRFTLAETETAGRYRVAFAGGTQGLANWFFRSTVVAASTGSLEDGLPHPESYVSDSSGRTSRHTRLAYRPDGTIEAELTPLPGTDAEGPVTPIPPATLPGTTDPLSGLLAIARAIAVPERCGGTVPVYDGRRRYDLLLHAEGPDTVEPAAGHAYAGPAERCALHLQRIGGYPVDPRKLIAGTEAVLWIARVAPDLPPLPVEVAFHARWGVLRAHLMTAGSSPSGGTPPG